jgi:cbb3-type cytochrome oxidase subunit 1
MSPTVRAFLKSSLAWLALGVTFGVAMAAHPVWTLYRLAHIHMMLLGFVAMMIFGVAYHVIPRFSGFPLHRPAGARAHWWFSNVGLAAMASGFVLRVHAPSAGTILLAAGGLLSALGAYIFVYLIWRTIDGPRTLRVGAERARKAMESGGRAARRPLSVLTTPPNAPPPAA